MLAAGGSPGSPPGARAGGARSPVGARPPRAPLHYTRTVLNRRQAAVGYLTFLVARRVVRRTMRRKLAGLRPSAVGRRALGANRRIDATREGERMLRSGKSAGRRGVDKTRSLGSTGADRATAVVEAIRPIVTRAVNDQNLHQAVRNAFETGRQVNSKVHGKKASKAARKLADDQKLQKRVTASANELRDAVFGVFEQPKRKRRRGRLLALVAGAAALAAAVPFLRKKLGGDDEDEFNDFGAPPP